MVDRLDRPATERHSQQDALINPSQHGGGMYKIQIKGHLGCDWADWLEGFEMQLLENGEMILVGPVVDQAALIGMINKLYRLNLALLSINPVDLKGKETK